MLRHIGTGALIGAALAVGTCAYSVYTGQPFAAQAGPYSIAAGIVLGVVCGFVSWNDIERTTE